MDEVNIPNFNTFADIVDRLAVTTNKLAFFENKKREESEKSEPDLKLIALYDKLSRNECEYRNLLKRAMDDLLSKIVERGYYKTLPDNRTFSGPPKKISDIIEEICYVQAKSVKQELSLAMQSYFNDTYYKDQEKDAGEEVGGWRDQMVSAILEVTKDLPKTAKIIDVGCFTGEGLVALRNAGFTSIVGIDLIKRNIDRAREKGLNVMQMDMHDMSAIADKAHDFLFMSHAIEHAKDPIKVLKECTRIAKSGVIIFPIEPDKEEVCNPPHYSTFRSEKDVAEKLEKLPTSFTWVPKFRLGQEIWVYF